MDDEALAARASEDPDAFAELYRRHVRMVTGFAAGRVENAEELADVVAAVWLKVLQSIRRYDPDRARFASWLLGITANVVADTRRSNARRWRAQRRLAGRRQLDPDARAELEEAIDAQRVLPAVRAAMTHLTPSERQAIDLIAADVSYEEAAALLRVTPTSLRMRVHRARKRLDQLLNEAAVTTPAAGVEGEHR